MLSFFFKFRSIQKKIVQLRYKASFALFGYSVTISFFQDLDMQALLREQRVTWLSYYCKCSFKTPALRIQFCPKLVSLSLICWEAVGRGPWCIIGIGFICLAFLLQLQLDLLSRATMDFVVLFWLDFVLTDWSYAILHQTDTCLTLVF